MATGGTTKRSAARTMNRKTPEPLPATRSGGATQPLPAASQAAAEMSISVMRRHLLTIEELRDRVRRVLKCVINLHIDILVLESNVTQLLDEVKELNADMLEVQRLDDLIHTLRNYNGPTICHEWPYELIFKGTIDDADVAQILNATNSKAT